MPRKLSIIFAIILLAGPVTTIAKTAAKAAAPKIPVPAAKKGALPAPEFATAAYIVIDRKSGKVVAEKDADTVRPIASLTKMMSGLIVVDKKVSLNKIQPITATDKVGGSALNAKTGSKFTVGDLIYAAFLSSANDATNALADATKLSRDKFVAAMNAKAKTLKLTHTIFTEPTGIDDGNVSTPRELAVLAEAAFKQTIIRRAMLTAKRTLTVYPSKAKVTIKNANGMLWKPEFDDVWVSGGKTGYLGPGGGWNLAVSLRDTADKKKPELMMVLMGTETLKQSEDNAETLARWAWENFEWR
jgi:serine-type D-Ala-D-Ala endopeptidase (penicillin-binding protein 7)